MPHPSRASRSWLTIPLLAIVLALPAGIYFVLPRYAPAGAQPKLRPFEFPRFETSTLAFTQANLGRPPKHRPMITNVKIVDLDLDGLPDVLACDTHLGRVVWYRQAPLGEWEERVLGDTDLPAPCHTTLAELDGDGDQDIVVAVLGSVWPTNDRIGRVVWLENRGRDGFVTRLILDDLRRVTDVQVGDLNGDGRLDLAVAEFGYDIGRVVWLESRGEGKFRDHEIFTAPGPIHVPLADFDGDRDLDIVTLVSQDYEEVWGFENLGGGQFKKRVIAGTPNFDFGSAGLVMTDLDRDGKPDLLWVAGDNLEIRYPHPQPWHGCIWLRNLGGWKFEPKRIGTLGGTNAAAAGDMNGDGHLDVVLVSMFNDWRREGGTPSVVWLQNDGKQNFIPRQIADRPTHLATVAVGDLNGDGLADIVAGGFHIQGPFDRIGRITTWMSRKGPP